ncbi:MAG: Heimdall-CTERM domain-containing surface protein [Candidatus Thermoplasmatota archaeon]
MWGFTREEVTSSNSYSQYSDYAPNDEAPWDSETDMEEEKTTNEEEKVNETITDDTNKNQLKTGSSDEKKETPGFELITLLTSLFIGLIYLKRKN